MEENQDSQVPAAATGGQLHAVLGGKGKDALLVSKKWDEEGGPNETCVSKLKWWRGYSSATQLVRLFLYCCCWS